MGIVNQRPDQSRLTISPILGGRGAHHTRETLASKTAEQHSSSHQSDNATQNGRRQDGKPQSLHGFASGDISTPCEANSAQPSWNTSEQLLGRLTESDRGSSNRRSIQAPAFEATALVFPDSDHDPHARNPTMHLALPPRLQMTNDAPALPNPATPSSIQEKQMIWQLSSPAGQFSIAPSQLMVSKPRPSLARLASLDSLISYQKERAEWDRLSFTTPQMSLESCNKQSQATDVPSEIPRLQDRAMESKDEDDDVGEQSGCVNAVSEVPETEEPDRVLKVSESQKSKFRHITAEIGFCFSIAMTQFLAEYLISGFALELPRLLSRDRGSGMGAFWPASLLSLILSATLLVFARLSDMYGGYFLFMAGVLWLGLWTLIPGFLTTTTVLDISRAMQGLAISAFMPSTFSLVSSIYAEGRRKNFIMGLYSGCAPLGFFSGFLVAGALPDDKPRWFFWIAAIISLLTLITSYLTVPSERINKRNSQLKMDWIGAFLIIAGLILVSYALSMEPFLSQSHAGKASWTDKRVIGPFTSGMGCLVIALLYEGWLADCPLLPFDFFKPNSVKAFSLSCLCFYAAYSVWLYSSSELFQSATGTTKYQQGVTGVRLALWYLPTAVSGIVLCVVGGLIINVVPTLALLSISALSWVAAPLILALAPLPLNYWSFVMPSMVTSTLGLDLTYTVSVIFLSSVQPLHYQGLSGAICSILFNLAMSFSLPISEIVTVTAQSAAWAQFNQTVGEPGSDVTCTRCKNRGIQAALLYATASGSLGLIITVLLVRIPRCVFQTQKVEEEALRPTSSASTTVGNDEPACGENREEDGEKEKEDWRYSWGHRLFLSNRT